MVGIDDLTVGTVSGMIAASVAFSTCLPFLFAILSIKLETTISNSSVTLNSPDICSAGSTPNSSGTALGKGKVANAHCCYMVTQLHINHRAFADPIPIGRSLAASSIRQNGRPFFNPTLRRQKEYISQSRQRRPSTSSLYWSSPSPPSSRRWVCTKT